MNHASAPRTARARVRDELTREIKDVARAQLAEQGSAALSLRAVARELGMVSSAVYRYFPSRDELLTALIVDAYNAVGEAVEQAEASVRREDFAGRWLAATIAMRDWAVANPQEYALIFGTPVPGYRAPTTTIDPAVRIPLVLLSITGEAVAAGKPTPGSGRSIPRVVRADLKALRDTVAPGLTDGYLARALMAWTQLVGSISFELFGHLHNGIHDYKAYFAFQMRGIADDLGLL
ncbi:MAG: TetR/AcrR family transcriptional regulator [Actinomycetota bacterium]|nr:TetR/AcrR family transcriptional regulator [Actinomycetota bacterium]